MQSPLACSVSLADGKHNWTKRIDVDFGGKKPDYGFTTTPIVVAICGNVTRQKT